MILEGHSHNYDFIDEFEYGHFSKRDRMFKGKSLLIHRSRTLLNRSVSFGAPL